MEDSDDTLRALLAHLDQRLVETNGYTFNVARLLGPIGNLTKFSDIERMVAPRLFLAFMALPWVSEISYVRVNGLLFSYYNDNNKTIAVFSNASRSSSNSTAYYLYRQSVDQNTGEVLGDAIPFTQLAPDSQWLQDAFNGKSGNASLGVGWGKAGVQMLFFTAPVENTGVVSVGITVKDFVGNISSIYLQGGLVYIGPEDGTPLARYVLPNNTISVHSVDQKDNLQTAGYTNVSCQVENYTGRGVGPSNDNYSSILGSTYKYGCAELDMYGIRVVAVVALAYKKSITLVQNIKIVILQLESLMILGVIIGSYIVLLLFRRSQVHETLLRASLIKQKEKIQQEERKSMNKSLAFASASHDVRNNLAAITGLVELCRTDAPQDSELDRNLEKANSCASKLLGILNSVLDTSKVEAGKMQLEEVEFDMAQVLEESVDIFHVVALKKGIEVIWDPCDCSVFRSSKVKGDCRRLAQILDNLLGNAVKFTSKGHVVVRAWAKKPSIENLKHSYKHGCHFTNLFDCLPGGLQKDMDADVNLETLNAIQHDPNSIEFIFEVDDTGIGIPKEKRASVFENYVQVKESTVGGHEGTGLGLGIVQSYVHLMGGNINIQDKEPGERGTCFRFNIFLKSSEISFDAEGEGTNTNSNPVSNLSHERYIFASSNQHTEKNDAVQSNIRAMAFRRGLKMEGIRSLLLVQGDETRRILQRWMENSGINVWAILQPELLYPSLEKIKRNLNASKRFDSVSSIISLENDCNKEKEEYSSSKDEDDQNLPITNKKDHNRTSSRGSSTCVIVIIDMSCGNITEMCSILKKFTSSIHNIQCKIVWLANSDTPSADLGISREVVCDLILQKPLHGSRLYALLKLLQEFGGIKEGHPPQMQNSSDGVQGSTNQGTAIYTSKIPFNSLAPQTRQHFQERSLMRCNVDDEKPLSGVNILLVEDASILRHLATIMLSRFGATVESCENGLDALSLIKKALREAAYLHDGSVRVQGTSKNFRYDIVLMDCEMPIMNGYEATRHIREEEKYYGLHVPIIALTAHTTPEEERKMVIFGMDFYLTKPLQIDQLLKAINSVCQKKSINVQ
ncbi:putative histidine kinase 2 [Cocos nucifera]|nr:putative histidine kinase 2 [Cocos nucifera]